MNVGIFFFIAIVKKVVLVDSRNMHSFVFRFGLLVKNKRINDKKS